MGILQYRDVEGSFEMVEINNLISFRFTECVQADTKHK